MTDAIETPVISNGLMNAKQLKVWGERYGIPHGFWDKAVRDKVNPLPCAMLNSRKLYNEKHVLAYLDKLTGATGQVPPKKTRPSRKHPVDIKASEATLS